MKRRFLLAWLIVFHLILIGTVHFNGLAAEKVRIAQPFTGPTCDVDDRFFEEFRKQHIG